MKISAPTSNDVLKVAAQMRPRDLEEFMAVSPMTDPQYLAQALAFRYGSKSDTFGAYLDDGTPVAIGAMVQYRPNVVTLMFFATEAFPQIATGLTKFIVQRLFPKYRAAGIHRIECASLDGYTDVHRWIELLGLKREAKMPGYGKNGETYIQFAWVSDCKSV